MMKFISALEKLGKSAMLGKRFANSILKKDSLNKPSSIRGILAALLLSDFRRDERNRAKREALKKIQWLEDVKAQ